MAATRPSGGLGRGLGSLLGGPDAAATPGTPSPASTVPPQGTSPTPPASAASAASSAATDDLSTTQAHYAELPVTAIHANPRQPRQVFDEDALAELVHSIREIGLLQPIVVRPSGTDTYEIVAGERRWRAVQQAGLATVPAIVRHTDDDNLLRDALLENLHRVQLNPLEEAAAYQQLLDDFGCTQEELAERIGRSRPQISNTLRLLRLPPSVARRVAAGVLSAGHAKVLLSLDDDALIETLASRVIAEGISVRGLEEIIALGVSPDDKPERKRRTKPHAPGLDALAERLGDALDTRVRIDMGRSKGRIVIEVATMDDLQRVIDVITHD